MATAPWDMWLYKGQEARLFLEGEELPQGWRDRPGHPLDHDGDGRPGGSLKGSRRKKGA